MSARVALCAILLLAGALRLYTLDLRPLWEDEAWALSAVYRNDPAFSIRFDLLRWNPPRMYATHLLLSLLTANLLGTDPWSLRIPSVAFGILAVGMTYALGALWFSRRVGFCAALFSALNVEQILRSQEMRPYSLLPALALTSTYLLTKALRGGAATYRTYAAYALVTVLLAYCHLSALLVIAAQWMYVAATERAGSFRFAGPLPWLSLFWCAIYAPAAWVFVSNLNVSPLNTGVSVAATGPSLVAAYRALIMGDGGTTALVLPLVLCAVGAWSAMRVHRSQAAALFLTFLAVIPFAGWLLSGWSARTFVPIKYMIYASPALHLLAARGLTSLPGRWTLPVLLLGLLATTIAPLGSYYQRFTRPAYDQAAAYIRRHRQPAPIFVGNGSRVVSYYYLDEYPRLGSAAWQSFVERVPLRPIEFGARAEPIDPRSFWVERMAPDVYWHGSTPLDTFASLPAMSHIWRVDDTGECADFYAGSKRFKLVDERAFDGGVRACLFEIEYVTRFASVSAGRRASSPSPQRTANSLVMAG